MNRDERQATVYVVYPAALFDGWEVVRERDDEPVFFEAREAAIAYADGRAAVGGGAIVKVENWFGATESVREIPSGVPTVRSRRRGGRRRAEELGATTRRVPPSSHARRVDRRHRTPSH